MSKKTTTLYGYPLATKTGFQFTANNLVPYVDVDPVDPTDRVQHLVDARTNASVPYTMAGKNSFFIESIGVIMPMNFELYERPFLLSFNAYESAEIDLNKKWVVPGENFELKVNEFVDMSSKTVTAGFHFRIGIIDKFRVSMLNVPDILNGQTFQIKAFAKITHSEVLG